MPHENHIDEIDTASATSQADALGSADLVGQVVTGMAEEVFSDDLQQLEITFSGGASIVLPMGSKGVPHQGDILARAKLSGKRVVKAFLDSASEPPMFHVVLDGGWRMVVWGD